MAPAARSTREPRTCAGAPRSHRRRPGGRHTHRARLAFRMRPHLLTDRSIRRLLLALALLPGLCGAALAAAPARRPAAPDSESAPGRLIAPPAPAPPPAAAAAPADTALASLRKKARVEFGRGLLLEEQPPY